MNIEEFKNQLSTEVGDILSNEFSISVTKTNTVPHSGDPAITYPNFDTLQQGAKLIETCVLYIDIRRSTELNFQHRQATVAKLYSAFVRAMTRCARRHHGHVRGIIGDRVMVLFDTEKCFEQAVDTAITMNSVAQHVINKHFKANEVTFGVGVAHGSMLATKTGLVRRGQEHSSYRNLVWLGRPANVASKLTDLANKAARISLVPAVHVGRISNMSNEWTWISEDIETFLGHFEKIRFIPPLQWNMNDPNIHGFFATNEPEVSRPKTPAILMTNEVYHGLKAAKPDHTTLTKNLWHKIDITVPGHTGTIYGGNVVWTAFQS